MIWNLRLDETTKELWVAHAEADGMTLSQFVRQAVAEKIAGPGSSAADVDGAGKDAERSAPAGHHESVGERQGRQPAPAKSRARSLTAHRADPKDKASQEHGKRERAPASGMCEHRIPKGSFCKACAS